MHQACSTHTHTHTHTHTSCQPTSCPLSKPDPSCGAGRAAMLGIASVLVANSIPGAIPLPIDFPDGASLITPF